MVHLTHIALFSQFEGNFQSRFHFYIGFLDFLKRKKIVITKLYLKIIELITALNISKCNVEELKKEKACIEMLILSSCVGYILHEAKFLRKQLHNNKSGRLNTK